MAEHPHKHIQKASARRCVDARNPLWHAREAFGGWKHSQHLGHPSRRRPSSNRQSPKGQHSSYLGAASCPVFVVCLLLGVLGSLLGFQDPLMFLASWLLGFSASGLRCIPGRRAPSIAALLSWKAIKGIWPAASLWHSSLRVILVRCQRPHV